MVRRVLFCFAMVAAARHGWAQDRVSANRVDVSSAPNPTISVTYELHRDRLHYGFENPSSIDTPFLVPHRFDQTYVADNHWLVAAARYRLFGDVMETEFGLTPRKTAFGSDLDTFRDPNGDVIVAGTESDVSIHSFRFAQWSDATLWGMPWRVGYLYRRDTADFHASERLVTHSNPSSRSSTPIHTHETTISEVHEIAIGAGRLIALAPGWVMTAGADFSPIMVAKDTTILPEKYPGQEIEFLAKGAALLTRVEVKWNARLPVTISLRYGRTWSYRSSSVFDRDLLDFGVGLGFGS